MKEIRCQSYYLLSMPNSASETFLQLHNPEGWMGISTTDNFGAYIQP